MIRTRESFVVSIVSALVAVCGQWPLATAADGTDSVATRCVEAPVRGLLDQCTEPLSVPNASRAIDPLGAFAAHAPEKVSADQPVKIPRLNALAADPPCPWAGCLPSAVPEGEICLKAEFDNINGGCISPVFAFGAVTPGQPVCGHVWADIVNGASYRDTDWYLHPLRVGDKVTWCVDANFPFLASIMDLSSGCGSPINLFDTASGGICDPVCVSATATHTGDFVFFVAPRAFEGFPCVTGPWEYNATLTECLCPCQYDPQCDGVISDVLDVVETVNRAFRGFSPPAGEDGICPKERRDVDASGAVDVIDVVKVVSVAFRGGLVADNYVDPCL